MFNSKNTTSKMYHKIPNHTLIYYLKEEEKDLLRKINSFDYAKGIRLFSIYIAENKEVLIEFENFVDIYTKDKDITLDNEYKRKLIKSFLIYKAKINKTKGKRK